LRNAVPQTPFFAGADGPHFFSGGGTTIQAKPAAKAPPVPIFYRSDSGSIYSDASMTQRIGMQANGRHFIFVDEKGNNVSLDTATIGSLTAANPGGTVFVIGGLIVRVKEVSVTDSPGSASPDAGVKAPDTGPKSPDAGRKSPDAEAKAPDAGTKSQAITIKPTGNITAVLWDIGSDIFSDKIMQSAGSNLSPIALESFPAGIQPQLTEGSVISLNDGHMWFVMSFHNASEKKDTPRWVAGKMTKKEQQTQQDKIDKQHEKLPDNLKQQIAPERKIIGAVSSIEGNFESTSGSGDSSASLGIFQWAMTSDQKEAGSSLALFFRTLRRRAADALKIKASARTAEQKLYIDAWTACTDQKLDVDGTGFVTLNGKQATGAEIETAMHSVFGSSPSLRNYQLVAASDWIHQFDELTVKPGPLGPRLVGNGYSEVSANMVSFAPDKQHTILVSAPDATTTVSDYLSSEKARAMVTMFGVNRPAWVAPALWRALDPTLDPKKRTEELLAILTRTPAGTPSTKKKITINQASAEAAGDEAASAYKELQALLWPMKNVSDENALIAEFQRQALLLYPSWEITKGHREQRFSSVEQAFHE
jgi:hypothetical protein